VSFQLTVDVCCFKALGKLPKQIKCVCHRGVTVTPRHTYGECRNDNVSFVETALVVCDVCEGRGFVKLRGGGKKA
jgi:hypothetical protein